MTIFIILLPQNIKNNSSKFDKKLFKKYLIYYEDSFRKILRLRHINKHTKILYLSTSYIDKKLKDLKNILELKLEKWLALNLKINFKIYKPRLPAVLTDQKFLLFLKNIMTY